MRALRIACARLGMQPVKTVEGIHVTIRVEAPAGQIFKASDTHELVANGFVGIGTVDMLAADLLERVNYRLDTCTDNECEWCHDC